MLKILFFAKLREDLDTAEVRLDYRPGQTVADILACLCDRGEPWSQALGQDNLMIAVNQEMCDRQHGVCDGDEVAFFPPVTGG